MYTQIYILSEIKIKKKIVFNGIENAFKTQNVFTLYQNFYPLFMLTKKIHDNPHFFTFIQNFINNIINKTLSLFCTEAKCLSILVHSALSNGLLKISAFFLN